MFMLLIIVVVIVVVVYVVDAVLTCLWTANPMLVVVVGLYMGVINSCKSKYKNSYCLNLNFMQEINII